MTPKQQRIAIAEACGWVHHNTRTSETERHQKKWRYVSDLPDYLNDLNAMHEAEETLQESQRGTYSSELYDLAVEHQLKTGKWRYLSMTAAQRAEAFLRTLNLWEE